MPKEVFEYIANTFELKKWLAAYDHLSMEQKNFLNTSYQVFGLYKIMHAKREQGRI